MANVIGNVVNSVTNVINAITNAQSINSTGSFTFPSNLSANYYMFLNFYQYQRQSPMAVGTAQQKGSLRLPIPANIMDAQSVNFVEEEISTSLGGAAESFLGQDMGSFADAAKGATAAIGAGAISGVGKIFPGAATLGGVKFGISANPFLTVLFKNPNYREYDFSWRFFPRNPAESGTLQRIYNSVKYHMLPSAVSDYGGAVLTYPSLVKVQIKAGNRSLIPFKYGVIKAASFNFTPDGVPSFHKAGEPTAVDLRIQIQEVEYFLKGDNPRMFSI